MSYFDTSSSNYYKYYKDKQGRPRSDAAFCGMSVWLHRVSMVIWLLLDPPLTHRSQSIYNRLSSRIPRDSLEHFEISVCRNTYRFLNSSFPQSCWNIIPFLFLIIIFISSSNNKLSTSRNFFIITCWNPTWLASLWFLKYNYTDDVHVFTLKTQLLTKHCKFWTICLTT